MKLVFHRRGEVVDFVTTRIRHPLCYDGAAFEALGVEDAAGKLRAGAIFHHYKPVLGGHDIEVNGAGDPGWFTKSTGPQILREAFLFAFWTLACVRITATVAKAHKRSRRLMEHMGFRQEGTHKWGLGYRKTALTFGMTFEDCAWIGPGDKDAIRARIEGMK